MTLNENGYSHGYAQPIDQLYMKSLESIGRWSTTRHTLVFHDSLAGENQARHSVGSRAPKGFGLTALFLRCMVVFAMIIMLVSCSTREVSDSVSGATAQRLVTYSLEKFLADLVEQPELQAVKGANVNLRVYFLDDHDLLVYANRLLKHHLEQQFQVVLTDDAEIADFDIDVFFNSIGTDYDTYGLSIPTLGLGATADSRISILSLDMFHGITEGYALVKNNSQNTSLQTERLLARVRADDVTTPILSFPIGEVK